jgi:Ca2+-binding RTX toxin-like protein
VVFSGSGSDRIYGDHLAGTLSDGDGSDTLFGGAGNDVIYGDSVDGQQDGAAAGDDALFGGSGNDIVYGGRGEDFLTDIDDSSLYGGDGRDILVLHLSGVFSADGVANSGSESANDGNDRVFINGFYESVTSELGAGNDLFISLATGDNGEGEGGAKTDRVSGGTGQDIVSTWFGDDTIDGGAGGDGLWGGAGADTIFGGPDTDVLYGGAGDGDVLVGGDGSDYYYWARTDGIDRVDDQDIVAGGESENYILVFSGHDETGEMPAGSGVFEADQDLYDNAGGDDMVQLTLDPDGDGSTEYILTILQGEGAGSQLYFDSDEVSVIGLWNNDATAGTPVITAYVWDPIDGRYEYQA